MTNFPDFSKHGYEVLDELGHNYAGGRVTYLAEEAIAKKKVVIKLFRFPVSASEFSNYEKSIQREEQVLKDLNHRGIPQYLNGFHEESGYCLVQEYKNAQPLSIKRSFSPDQIKEIALALLEILVYLQERMPPIIHRDIKPENVLVDDSLNVYLVDFGFARIGGHELAMSSVAAGTFGFMAPEQLRNRELTTATDLYGLGATLICLLTGTKSTAIDTLTNEKNRINFKHLTPNLSPKFVLWLERLTAPSLADRIPSAQVALASLQGLEVSASEKLSNSQKPAKPQGKKATVSIQISLPMLLIGGVLFAVAAIALVLWRPNDKPKLTNLPSSLPSHQNVNLAQIFHYKKYGKFASSIYEFSSDNAPLNTVDFFYRMSFKHNPKMKDGIGGVTTELTPKDNSQKYYVGQVFLIDQMLNPTSKSNTWGNLSFASILCESEYEYGKMGLRGPMLAPYLVNGTPKCGKNTIPSGE